MAAAYDMVPQPGGGKAWAAPAAGIRTDAAQGFAGGHGFSGSGVVSQIVTVAARAVAFGMFALVSILQPVSLAQEHLA